MIQYAGMYEQNNYRHHVMLIIMVGGFLMSFVCGLFPAVLALIALLPGVGSVEVSAFVGSGSLAHIAVSFMSGFIIRRIGIRVMIGLAAALFSISAIVLLIPHCCVLPLCLGNVFRGAAFGIVTAVSPLLIVEGLAANRHNGGSAWYQFSMQLGVVAGALFGTISARISDGNVRMALSIDCAPVLCLSLVFLVLILRTPRLPFLRDEPKHFKLAMLKRHWGGVLKAAVFMFFVSACGMGTVRNFQVILLSEHGFSGALANLIDSILSITSVIAVFIMCVRLNECSRFRLLRWGAVLMFVGYAGAALATRVGFAMFLALISIAFSIGFGACSWVVVPKVMPKEIRAEGMALSLLVGQLTTFFFSTLFPIVVSVLGLSNCFIFFACVSIAAVPFFGIMKRTNEEGE